MIDTILTPLTLISKLLGIIKMGAKAGGYASLNDYIKMTRLEPLVLVDEECVHLPYIEDVMKTLTSIFAASYLQGIAVSVNVGKVNVMRLLDRLNPNRSPMDSLVFATESLMNPAYYRFGLPSFNIALESNQPFPKPNGVPMVSVDVPEEPEKNSGVRFGKDAISIINSEANLATGMVLDVEIESDGQKATIPVTLRLIANSVDPDTFLQIYSTAEKKRTAKERYHGWRAGELKFWDDIVMCRDLADAHRKTLLNDKAGAYAEIMRRRQSNRVSGFLTQNMSVASASNMAIMGTSTLSLIETTIGGRLSNFKLRERIFDSSYLMTMVVIDPRYEQVIIYHRGLELPTTLNVKGIKAANKGKGVDISEILRAFQLGTTPRF